MSESSRDDLIRRTGLTAVELGDLLGVDRGTVKQYQPRRRGSPMLDRFLALLAWQAENGKTDVFDFLTAFNAKNAAK